MLWQTGPCAVQGLHYISYLNCPSLAVMRHAVCVLLKSAAPAFQYDL